MPTLDSVTFGLNVNATLNNAQALVNATAPMTYAKSGAFTNGVGVGQADKIWSATRTILASGVDDLDLNGVLLDPLGAILPLLRIKLLAVVASGLNTNNVVMGAAAANPLTSILGATATLPIRPGGFLLLTAPDATGYPVVAATGDILRFANSAGGTPVSYDIVIIGASA